MSDKHTPGPWFVKYRHMDIQVCAPDPEDDTPWNIARVDNYAGPGDATEANARLIAAAPELLEAIRPFAAILEIFRQGSASRPTTGEIMVWEDHRVGRRELTVEMLEAALAAVAKVEGGE